LFEKNEIKQKVLVQGVFFGSINAFPPAPWTVALTSGEVALVGLTNPGWWGTRGGAKGLKCR